MSEASLRIDRLTRRFGKRVAVDGLSFELAAGEVVGLLGPNGAGKTTTLLCLSGLLRPNSGTISYNGKVLGAERTRTISLIPETPEVYGMLTVWEHLVFVARSLKLAAGWEARASELLERFEIANQRNTLGQALSKGMRQKTLIAATVLADAPVLLFDEPLVGLDPKGQRELRELILQLRDAGTAILMSTHLIEYAAALCERVIILKDGKAVASGSIGDLHARAEAGETLEDIFLEITA